MKNSSSTFFTRFLFLQLAIAALLALPVKAQVPHVRPINLPQTSRGSMLRADVHQYVRGHRTINIKQLIREQNGIQLRGPEIERIILIGSSQSRFGAQAQLIINNLRTSMVQRIDGINDKVVFPLNRLSRSPSVIQSLVLEMSGDAFIEQILVKTNDLLSPRLITIPINANLFGRSSVRLSDLIQSRSHLPQGEIMSLSLEVRSRSQGALGVVVRGLGMIQREQVSYGIQDLQISLPLGTQLNEILLNSNGEIELLSMTLELQDTFENEWISF